MTPYVPALVSPPFFLHTMLETTIDPSAFQQQMTAKAPEARASGIGQPDTVAPLKELLLGGIRAANREQALSEAGILRLLGNGVDGMASTAERSTATTERIVLPLQVAARALWELFQLEDMPVDEEELGMPGTEQPVEPNTTGFHREDALAV